MTIGYRAVIQLPVFVSAIDAVEEEFRFWAEEKGYPKGLDFDHPLMHRRDANNSIAVAGHASGDSRAKSFILLENNSSRLWKVSIYAFTRLGDSPDQLVIIEVDVTHSSGENPVDLIEPPRIARNLLRKYAASDGTTRLLPSTAFLSTKEEIVELVRNISDGNRRATINVAPSPGAALDKAWQQLIDNLVGRGVGNSSTYIVDENHISQFNSLIGGVNFGAGAGTVRSYVPGFDSSDPATRGDHRYIKTSGLQKSIDYRGGKWIASKHLQKAFSLATRLRFIQTEVPHAVRDLVAQLDEAIEQLRQNEKRQEKLRQASVPQDESQSQKISTPFPGAATTDEPYGSNPAWQRFRKFVKRVLGHEDISVKEIETLEAVFVRNEADLEASEELMKEAEAKTRETLATANQLRESDSNIRSQLEQEKRRVRQLEFENTRLRRSAAQTLEQDFASPFEMDPPQLMEQLVSRVKEDGDPEYAWIRDNVVFTGSEDSAMQLDSQAGASIYVDAVWDQVAVLYDYVESKKSNPPFKGDVDTYLRSPSDHSGKTTGVKNHAPTESSQVKDNPKYWRPRLLPVPTSVRTDGFVEMYAHFRIDTSNTIAPRLHYFDDTANTGKVYVGYIGRHLPNPKTN